MTGRCARLWWRGVARKRSDVGVTLRTRVWAIWTEWRVLNAQHAAHCRHDGSGPLCWLCRIAEYEGGRFNNGPTRGRNDA